MEKSSYDITRRKVMSGRFEAKRPKKAVPTSGGFPWSDITEDMPTRQTGLIDTGGPGLRESKRLARTFATRDGGCDRCGSPLSVFAASGLCDECSNDMQVDRAISTGVSCHSSVIASNASKIAARHAAEKIWFVRSS